MIATYGHIALLLLGSAVAESVAHPISKPQTTDSWFKSGSLPFGVAKALPPDWGMTIKWAPPLKTLAVSSLLWCGVYR